jgi:hypothetical protein
MVDKGIDVRIYLQRATCYRKSSTSDSIGFAGMGSALVDAHDKWHVADKRYRSETTLALLNPADQPEQNMATQAALTA